MKGPRSETQAVGLVTLSMDAPARPIRKPDPRAGCRGIHEPEFHVRTNREGLRLRLRVRELGMGQQRSKLF
jgi:hypothetical protein